MVSIECLPDELWLEIFSYIPYLDLFRCFCGLNERINTIVYSKRIKLKLKSDINYEKFKPLIESLSEYIVGLCIDYYHQDIDISPFNNLLSLHLSHATDTQIAQIQLNNLKYLRQLEIVVCSTNVQLGDFLFGAAKQNYLITCWVPNLEFYFKNDHQYQPCLTLRSLRLNYCCRQTLFNLLYLLPNLINFETSLISLPSNDTSVCFQLPEHATLMYFNMSLRADVPLTDLESIFIHVPCLEELHLCIHRPNNATKDVDLVQLTNIIQSHLRSMKKCDIKIYSTSSISKITLEDLKSMSSS